MRAEAALVIVSEVVKVFEATRKGALGVEPGERVGEMRAVDIGDEVRRGRRRGRA